MKGFFKWFKSGAKMKRWILVILIGILLACYSAGEIIAMKELSFIEVGKIIISFVVGFTLIIVGLVYSQKRVLEILIEDSDSRITSDKSRKNVNVKSLIFNKNVYDKGPKIVAIGGGSGLNTVLRGLKKYTDNITAIVTVSDYGKDRTYSNEQLRLKPVEDIKESIIALANNEEEMQKLFNQKFTTGNLSGLEFGDVFVSAMENTYHDFVKSIEQISKTLNIEGKILPVTLDPVDICAELEDGTIIDKKDKIEHTVNEKVSKINRIFLNPTNCRVAPGVLEAIKEADAIIIGPGSLYTNVIPNLLVKNVAKTIKESNAKKIYISNIMTEAGQTDDYSLSDHVNTIIEHTGEGILNYCIYDTGEIVPEYIKMYNAKGADIVEQDTSKLRAKGIKLIQRNLSCIENGSIRHDANSVAESIIGIICNDMKYDEENVSAEYVMLKNRLKEGKKKNKPFKQNKKKQAKLSKKDSKAKHIGKQSKFQSKYKERIKSIKSSDEKRIENLKKEQKK